MPRRRLLLLALLLAAAAAGVIVISAAGARGFGFGHGPGMMGGYQGGYGPGMMGGYQGGYGPGMMYRFGRSAGDATLLIRHQHAHCHVWSLDGGAFRAAERLSLHAGSTLTVINMDVMPHRLIELAGPKISMRNGTTMPMMNGYVSHMPGLMGHMGASTTLRFAKPGTYRFRTRAGEDYFSGVETSGRDNVLTLTVVVR